MGPKSRFDCQGRDENRVSAQIFESADNQRRQILRSNAVFKTVPAFFHSLGRFLPVTTGSSGSTATPCQRQQSTKFGRSRTCSKAVSWTP